MSDLARTALITGASSGIGAVYADRLARRGHDLVLVARDKLGLEAVAQALRRETGVAVESLAADLSTDAGQSVVAERLRRDDLVLLVNNAGIAEAGPTATMDAEALRRMMTLNVVAPAALARAVAPGLISRHGGAIINIASIASLAGAKPGVSVGYSSSKAFVLAFSEGLATELSPHGVLVQAVLPGATRTPIWGKSGLDVDSLPDATVMGVDELVDAAIIGLDQGEVITIPGLDDANLWQAFVETRASLSAALPARHPARRYRSGA